MITRHAQVRVQQRGIPPMILDWLLDFGAREHYSGSEVVYFDKAARRRLRTYAGQLADKASDYLEAYAVVRGDTVVTVGYRHKHLKRH